MKVELTQFLKDKGLSDDDILIIDRYIEEERNEYYTVGCSVIEVQELNPFYSIDEAIELLEELSIDGWCWQNVTDRLYELYKENNAPQAYIEAVTTIFSRILGEDLYKLYMTYNEGFFEHFQDQYIYNSSFVDSLYKSINLDTIEDLVKSACIKYIQKKKFTNAKSNSHIDLLVEILDTALESNPKLLTFNLISQINDFYSNHLNVTNIELLKLWEKYKN